MGKKWRNLTSMEEANSYSGLISNIWWGYGTKYCWKCLVLFLFLSFLKALDSICLILSLLTPIISPISCRVFVLPSSIPNLHLTTCLSLELRLSSASCRSFFMNCLRSCSSADSASGSEIISW